MAHADRRRDALTGMHVAAVIVAVILATAVLPPAAAYRLNRSRIESAQDTAFQIAGYLQIDREAVLALATRTDVICGFGRAPKARAASDRWLQSPMAVQEIYGASRPTDPWGRCFLLNAGALREGRPVLVLSAGPNGFIDTPIEADAPAADDVGVRVY